MNCTISDNKIDLLSKTLGMSKEQIREIVGSLDKLDDNDKLGMAFNPDSIAVRALNHQGVTYQGNKAQVLKVDTVTNIPEDTQVTVHLKVGDKYVRDTLGPLSLSNLTTEGVLELQSSAKFVFDATNNPKVLALNAVNNPESIRELVKELDTYDRGLSTEERMFLDESLGNIIIPLSKSLPKMSVFLNEEAEMTGGKIELLGGSGTVYLSSSRKKGDMSLREAYVHEMYHAVTAYILESKDPEVAGVRKAIEDLRDSFLASKEAQKVFKDSLPNKDTAAKDLEDLLNYFSDPKVGIHEFIAYARSNVGLFNAMSTLSTREQKEVYPNMAAKLLGIVRKVFNLLMDKALKRPKGNDAVQMTWLVDRMIRINQEQVKEKKYGIIANMFKVLESADSAVSKKIRDYQDKASKRPILFGDSKLTRYLRIPQNLLRALYDDKLRKMMSAGASFQGMELTSTVPTIIRHGMEGDKVSDIIQQKQMVNQYSDTRRENFRSQIRLKLREAFGREMTTEDFYGLNVMLETDYVSIMDRYDITELVDDKKRAVKIKELENELKKVVTKEEYNAFTFQANLLGNYMVTNKDHILLMKNAKNIVMRVASVAKTNPEPDPKIVEMVDTLAGLYAFNYSGKEAKNKLKDIINEENAKPDDMINGIVEVLHTVKGINESAKKDLFDNEVGISQQIKGYRVDVVDENVDIMVAPVSKEAELKKRGYIKVMEVNNHSSDRSGKQAIYKSALPIKNRIHKTGLRYKNTSARGTSFGQSHSRDGSAASNLKAQRDIKEARNLMYKKMKEVENGTYKPSIEDGKISPRFNERGDVLDFSYGMDNETKRKVLGADLDVFNIIGSTAASNFDKKASKEHNKELIEILFKDNIKNAPKYRGDKIIGNDGRVYKWIGPNSKKESDKELWSIFPDEGKHLFSVEAADGKVYRGFYVREDLANNILGFREKSVIDYGPFKYLGVRQKYVLQIGEEIMAALIKIYKSQILLRIPEVLFVNILSNFNSMLVYKVSPFKVLKYKLNAIKDLTDYIELAKERATLSFKVESGKASSEEKRRLGVIDNKMNMSSVKELMDVGFYNQILEDIEGDETGNIVKDAVGKQVAKMPEVVQNGLNWVWLSDTNPVIKFMETATQYSDFVARYALFNLLTKEKGMSKEKATNTVRGLFINYANANSPFLEWGNKMGFAMFTKYFTNVQRAILEMSKGNPITFLLYILGQNTLVDVPDITDSSFLTKDLTNLLYNPMEGMLHAAMPGSYVLADSLLR
jgi:hypothetical protein